MASMMSSVCGVSSGFSLTPCAGPRTGVDAKLVLSASRSGVRRQPLGLGLASAPTSERRGRRLSSLRRRAGGDDDERTKPETGSSESRFDDTVDEIQKALGRSFGGTLWFTVLLTLLAVFGGGYVYLVYNYADFNDIPILNGPQGL